MPEGIPYASSNVVAGTGLDLNYVGDHAMAYSGIVNTVQDTYATVLDFTTGSGYIEGTIGFYGPAKDDDAASGSNGLFKLFFNDQIILYVNQELVNEDMATASAIPLIVPPFTNVRVEVIGPANNYLTSAVFVGKVHK